MAKDVAAFANAQGGTVLVGAAGGDELQRYKPIDSSTADAVQRAIDGAVRDRCRPPPLFSIERIASNDGLVLAVNVWPFPGQAVGVYFKPGEVAAGKKKSFREDACYFPHRVGTNTKTIGAEQLPYLMDAALRRTAIALAESKGKKANVVSAPRGTTRYSATMPVFVGDVDPSQNLLVVMVGRTEVIIPLDHVTAVRRGDEWHLFLRGSLTGGNDRVVYFEPPLRASADGTAILKA